MSNVRYLYLHDANGKKHGVIAYSVSDVTSGKVSFGLSVCNSEHDLFDKELGRALATNRLATMPKQIGTSKIASNSEIVKALLKKVSRSGSVPTRAKKAAKITLSRKERQTISF